jgi:putative transposase
VRFAFIATEKARFPVALMCRMLEVSRAGFYAWRRRPLAARSRQDQMPAVTVAAIYREHHGRYGSPRVQMERRDRGQCGGGKRIARLMRIQGCARGPAAAIARPRIPATACQSVLTCWRAASPWPGPTPRG